MTNALCAKTCKGIPYRFSLSDVPVCIDEHHFALLNKENSPLLLTDTIVAGMDIPDLYEGTIIRSGGVLYTISFKRGFAAMDENRNVFKLSELPSPYTIEGEVTSFEGLCRQRLTFRYKGINFQIKDIIGVVHDNLVIKEYHTCIPLKEVQQFAGTSYKGNKVFFGDKVEAGTIVLHKGRVCIYNGATYIDIVDRKEVI